MGRRRGATSTEYGLIGALIAVVIIGALTSVGQNTKSTLTSVFWALDPWIPYAYYGTYHDEFAMIHDVDDGNQQVTWWDGFDKISAIYESGEDFVVVSPSATNFAKLQYTVNGEGTMVFCQGSNFATSTEAATSSSDRNDLSTGCGGAAWTELDPN
jgi:pilus assembly protein Flp/PilA